MTTEQQAKQEIIKAADNAGGWVALAEQLGVTYQTVNRWRKEPPPQFEQYEQILRMNRVRNPENLYKQTAKELHRLLEKAARQGYPDLGPYERALKALNEIL